MTMRVGIVSRASLSRDDRSFGVNLTVKISEGEVFVAYIPFEQMAEFFISNDLGTLSDVEGKPCYYEEDGPRGACKFVRMWRR